MSRPLALDAFWNAESFRFKKVIHYLWQLHFCIHTQTNGSRYLRDACTPTLTGASFLTHHRGKHPKYPSTDEWIETGGYIIHTIEYDSARKDRNSDTHHNMEEK